MPTQIERVARAVDADTFVQIARWLRSHAAKLQQESCARKQAAAAMRGATGAELKAAAQLAARMTGKPMNVMMSVGAAKRSANTDSTIAGRLDGETFILSAWADFLEQQAAIDAALKEG